MNRSLQSAYLLGWMALRRPRIFFARLIDDPPLSAALLWLVALGCLSGLSGLHVGLQERASYGQDWWREVPAAKAVVQAVWYCVTDMFWAALLTWLLARIARETLRFDSLFTVLAFGMFPYLLSTLTFPLRNVSWLSYHIWQAVHVGVVAWASVLICLGVQACLRGGSAPGSPAGLGRAAQCGLPALLMLWAFGYRAHVASPTSFRAACPWLHQDGKTVRVYYPPGKSAREVTRIVEGLDGEMQQECALLNVTPLPDKVSVFCFADDDLQRKLAGEDEEPDNTAHTFWDCITTSYAPWQRMDNQMAHELCHILLAQRLTDRVHGLLDEGFCEYVAHAVAPAKDDEPPYAASPVPLRTLARSEVFFDWEQARDMDDNEWTHYTTGESLVTYLIQQHGIEKFKRFYARVATYSDKKDPDEEQGKAFARAAQESYGLSLPQLEAQWRHACPPPVSHPPTSRSASAHH